MTPIDLHKLGELMQHWHRSSGDPIYAVGSYFYSGSRYPEQHGGTEMEQRALRGIEGLLEHPHHSWGLSEIAELRLIATQLKEVLS